jgi:hypothetical protein
LAIGKNFNHRKVQRLNFFGRQTLWQPKFSIAQPCGNQKNSITINHMATMAAEISQLP